jgi:hypothetical protein
MATDPVEAVERVRESLIAADAEMQPGKARPGRALAHLVNAVEALANGLEAVAEAAPSEGDSK